MAGMLTTHVLDTMHGCPAAEIQIQLWRILTSGEGRELLRSTRTTGTGRTDAPLLQGAELLPGSYELIFAVGAYFASWKLALPEPAFLDLVPVRFGIADAEAHYHVPLLVSPWAYSTYRGS
jgi:5-hydroxyisourate hydrolase